MGKKHQKPLTEILSQYNKRSFKPENFNEIPRIFGESAAIDMNRLVCQHQQHVASAYMRRIRRDKIEQRDVYFKRLQNIPLKIRRMAVGPDYTDPYTSFKQRLPKLGKDNKIKRLPSPSVVQAAGEPYMTHNSLSPHINVLFKMNPGTNGAAVKGNTFKQGKLNPIENDLPFPLSPRRVKPLGLHINDPPHVRKRVSVDLTATKSNASSQRSSVDNTPRCPSNTPRNNATFWSFNIPNELNNSEKKSHVSSIPKHREALAAISSVQKHNKPLPAIVTKA